MRTYCHRKRLKYGSTERSLSTEITRGTSLSLDPRLGGHFGQCLTGGESHYDTFV